LLSLADSATDFLRTPPRTSIKSFGEISLAGFLGDSNEHDGKYARSRWRYDCGRQRPNLRPLYAVATFEEPGPLLLDCSVEARAIVLGEESAALRDLVSGLLSKGHRQILFNLAEVSYIDSTGLGSLVAALTSVRKEKGELKLLNLTNKAHNLMQITKLYTVFDIMNDETEGVKSFGQSTVAAA
jgi:anti-sigma B factor antagonist